MIYDLARLDSDDQSPTPTQGLGVILSPTHVVSLDATVIDRAQAIAWLARYHYPRQRPEYGTAVRLYAQMMRQQEWGISTIMLATYDGTPPRHAADTGEGPLLDPGTYIINGRHRLNAVIESGLAQTFLIEHHHCRRPIDVHLLYMAQDRGKSRQPADVYRALGMMDELELNTNELRLIGEAEGYIATSFGPRRSGMIIDAYQRAAFIREWAEEGRAWLHCLHGSRSIQKSYLSASPITAVALVILRFQPTKATTFLTAFTNDDGLKQGQPAKTLHDWVIETRVRGMQEHAYARYVISAWNAYWEGRTLDRLMTRDHERPVRIHGTPYVGKTPVGTSLTPEQLRRPSEGS
jgi:hypothetical protein